MIKRTLVIAATAAAVCLGTLGATTSADARPYHHYYGGPRVHFGFGFSPGYYGGYYPGPYSGASCRYWSRRYHHWVYTCGGGYPPPVVPYFSFGW